MLWTFIALQLISAVCVGHLWARARGSLLRKAAWSPLVLLPLIGPLLYGSVYQPTTRELDSVGTDHSAAHAGIGS